MGSGQERQLTKEEMEAREAAGSAATRRCVCIGLGCRGAECKFADFSSGNLGDFGTIGNGAPPQAYIHLNLGGSHSGSPPTKFGPNVTVL